MATILSTTAVCVVCSVLYQPGDQPHPLSLRQPPDVALCSARMTPDEAARFAREQATRSYPYVYFQRKEWPAARRSSRVTGPVTYCTDEGQLEWLLLSPQP